MRAKIIIICLLALISMAAHAQERRYEEAIYTEDYALSIYPEYPAVIGEQMTISLRTFYPAQKITLFTEREKEIPMYFSHGNWWANFSLPDDYKDGGHYFTVWIKYVQFTPGGFKPVWKKSRVNYKAFKKKEARSTDEAQAYSGPPEIGPGETGPPIISGEAMEINVSSLESGALLIKGSQSITFKTRSLDGSKEGEVQGTQQTREESLRLNVSGRASETDIDATFIRRSATGIENIGENEDKVSIQLKRGSAEAYLGDFTADLNETEFTRLETVMSGGKIKGDYGRWGFNLLYSSPKGEPYYSRSYGDGTQGPYKLDHSPVVIDSERVTVDGTPQKRGDDYTIDYQAGTVKFLKKIIDPRSIVQVNYDHRVTVYQHYTYGLRAFARPSPYFKIGVTYLDDSDIPGSVTQESVTPQSHTVMGVDGSLVSENISADGELAYSFKKMDLLTPQSTEENGGAAKFNFSGGCGPLGMKANFKTIGAKFQMVADPDPKQSLSECGLGLSFRPGPLFGGQANYAHQKYTRGGVIYENLYQDAKVQLTPERLPSLEYVFSEADESNDPVSGDPIRRIITRNSAETLFQRGAFAASAKGTKEKWLRRSPSEEATEYQRLNLGLATVGMEKIAFSTNLELEDRKEADGKEPYKRSYNVNLSASPAKQYYISSAIQLVDDSQLGQTNVTDISYQVQPFESFKAEGKYSISSVNEDFPVTAEGVSKQSGSFSFDLRPARQLRLRYLYKPSFTRILRTDTFSFQNNLQQTEVNLLPAKEILLGWVNKQGESFDLYKNDYPNYRAKEKSEEIGSDLYTLKMAPFQNMSIELNYLQEGSISSSLSSTQEPYTYLPGERKVKGIDLTARTSLSERFSFDARYTYQRLTEGSGEAAANLADSATHTGSMKGSWNLSDDWTVSVITAYSKNYDALLGQATYTVSPGAGFIFRYADKLRVDLDYLYSRSYAGLTTEKQNLSLKARYSMSDLVDLNLQLSQELSRSPDYRLTDLTANVEMKL